MADQLRPPSYRSKPGDRVYRVPKRIPWRVLVPPLPTKTGPRASLRTLPYGFAAMISVGTVLLMLPVATTSGQAAPVLTALFTSTSAVCVTGLVVVDTLDYWSVFGQAVILILIQFGGLGYMTMTTLLLLALRSRIGLRERLLIGESLGIPSRIGGLVRLIQRIALFSILAEIAGAAVFYIRFSEQYPQWSAVWTSVFQSVSAFNNAGFDIFGGFRSITHHATDYLVVLATGFLVVLGGISYLVVEDVLGTRKPRNYATDTKMVLVVTALLLALGTVVVLAMEYLNPATLGALSTGDKVLNAVFQSITPRSSGFSTIHTGSLTDYALFFTMLLMFIGGASGSVAGGIKVNTFGLIMSTIWSVVRGREHPGAFGREFYPAQIYGALAVLVLSLGTMAVVVFVLTITEDVRFLSLLFEAVSAFATVGLSTGITPGLSAAGQVVIIVTMFIGRLGPLTLTLALVRGRQPTRIRHPKEMVRVG